MISSRVIRNLHISVIVDPQLSYDDIVNGCSDLKDDDWITSKRVTSSQSPYYEDSNLLIGIVVTGWWEGDMGETHGNNRQELAPANI